MLDAYTRQRLDRMAVDVAVTRNSVEAIEKNLAGVKEHFENQEFRLLRVERRVYQVPLRFVNSAGQSLINAWWERQDDVAFTLNSSETESTVLCRIVNTSLPINRFVRPYNDQFEGALLLEAVEDSPKTGRPFIPDDDVFGLLDQNYNALIG